MDHIFVEKKTTKMKLDPMRKHNRSYKANHSRFRTILIDRRQQSVTKPHHWRGNLSTMVTTRCALVFLANCMITHLVCARLLETLPIARKEEKQIEFVQKLRERRNSDKIRKLQFTLNMLEADNYSADMTNFDDDLLTTIVDARKRAHSSEPKTKKKISLYEPIPVQTFSRKGGKGGSEGKKSMDKKSKGKCPGKGKGNCLASDFPSVSPSPSLSLSPFPSATNIPSSSYAPSEGKGKDSKDGKGMGKNGMGKGMMAMCSGKGKGECAQSVVPTSTLSPSPFATITNFPTSTDFPSFTVAPSIPKGKGMGMMMTMGKAMMAMCSGKGKGECLDSPAPTNTLSPSPSITESPSPTITDFPSLTSAPSKSKGKGMGMMMDMGKGMDKKCKDVNGMRMGKGKDSTNDCSEAPSTAPTLSAAPSTSFPPTGSTSSPTISPTSDPTNDPTSTPTTPNVSPNCEPTSGQCVSTLTDLQSDLDAADVGDIIALCQGTVVTTDTPIDISQSQITLCCIDSECTLLGAGSDSVLVVTGESVTLQDLRFEDGISTQFNGGNVAIEADGDHIIRNCEFVNGETDDIGGNLFVMTTGTLTIEGTSFLDGVATLAGGGLAVLDASQVTIRDSEFIGNDSTEGGGLYSSVSDLLTSQSQDLIIENTTFRRNTADLGAGFLVSSLGDLPSLSVLNNVFSDNTANEGGGAGAILVFLEEIDLSLNGNSGSANTGTLVCPDFLAVSSSSNDPVCLAVDATI